MRKPTLLKVAATAVLTVGLIGADSLHTKASTTTDAFISTMSTPVKTVANAYKLYPSVMMAQAALESGWGTSTLSTSANNYFGIKGSYNGQSVTMSTAEYDSSGQLYYTDAAFKKYPTISASLTDNAELLRNGISSDPTYYSGTWRENAATYEDAANALTGKYATAPTYGASLITLIQTYGFASLDSSSSSSTTTKKATIKYYSTLSGETGSLSSKYKSYDIYNHVKGSAYKTTKYKWTTVGGWSGRPVWFDGRAYKSDSKTTWYRIRFSKKTTAKRYWVYSKVVTLPKTTYTKVNKTATFTSTSNPVYNHVYNSSYLASQLTTTKSMGTGKMTVDCKAVIKQSGVSSTWYRVSNGKKTGWVKSTSISKLS
ncbi:glycoside hydrolase family 73 protein [Secundilactobacillus collinoides]|uniref:Muramidase (Flagellum-specific) n=1 Tax=Secundilactobacillus collinoides DSM 20515 = JCM 1123 TaxID=1423733 RepID=A0A0R2BD00_SECCO|nr:glucosaminidase domain-containing protein [Secundilactobacillus collinoides]KRM73772.1 muramidase (flagellum-specific) [Secundilactobacillus collinoides DSM 20515 = JCM 1123]